TDAAGSILAVLLPRPDSDSVSAATNPAKGGAASAADESKSSASSSSSSAAAAAAAATSETGLLKKPKKAKKVLRRDHVTVNVAELLAPAAAASAVWTSAAFANQFTPSSG